MSEQQATEKQIREALASAAPIILAPGPKEPPTQIPPVPNDVWDLPGGTAWVYYAEGHDRLTRPVIAADGFNMGPSSIDMLWQGLDWGQYAFFSELRSRGHDLIVVGFHERSAAIQKNADAVIEAITRACAMREGDQRLAVGGFSMGGLVTRYALTKMESQHVEHQTDLYWSYDTPHRGAWIPLGLQAFAHYSRKLNDGFSNQINSPAARQLLAWHIEEWDGKPRVDELREKLLAELDRMGNWPAIPVKIGVANGVGTGQGNGIKPGDRTVEGKGLAILGTHLYAQRSGDNQLVANLRLITPPPAKEVRTDDLPEIDGAPGGTLEGFGILADKLNEQPPILGLKTNAPIRHHSFVPSVSAVAIRDVTTNADLYVDIDGLEPETSELDDFRLASENQPHTLMTAELGGWIVEQIENRLG
ncbi:esterase/lipase family protein [Streptomyces sp. NPDC059949]|uniref:esterase/lipase family protein n=1 Tax=Streptomyces sp. NPDC059949 TaxID=3347013 RepID=UPI003661BA53